MNILVISTKAIDWVLKLDGDPYEIEWIGDPGQAMEILSKGVYELILLNDATLTQSTVQLVQEIKRRLPLIPVFVFSENEDPAYQTDLAAAGMDDFISPKLPTTEIMRRFELMLRQRRQNLALARRNRDLNLVMLLSRRLHSADHPLTLVLETIDLVSSTFNLYGVVIALDEGEKVHLYAGSAGVNNHRRLYESAITMHQYDPFRQCITMGIAQIYENLNDHPFYTPIPVLPDARSAIIAPLKYGDHTFGAICVLGTPTYVLSHEDLVIYELFSSHFSSAYHNVRHYYTQDVNVQSSQHLLRAWQRLTSLYKNRDIARTLRELVQDIPSVNETMVWIYEDGLTSEYTLSVPNPETQKAFDELHDSGHIARFLEQFDDRMQPQNFLLGRDKQNPLGPMFRAMNGQQLIMIPIMDSARLLGGVFVSMGTNQPSRVEDTNLMESLAHATGQTLERNALIYATEQQSGRLEAILRSIREGIFFVSDTGNVAFCNPQFTELTGINPSEVQDQPAEVLLDTLAKRSKDPVHVREMLDDAVERTISPQEENKDYPIVEIAIAELDHYISVEFIAITTTDEHSIWLGFMRSDEQVGNVSNSKRRFLLNNLSESINLPYARLYSSIIALRERHTNFSQRERGRLLEQLEKQAEKIDQLWSNFTHVYNMEVSGMVLDTEEVDPHELIQNILDGRTFNKYRRRVTVEAPPPRLPVEADPQYLEWALINVLQNAIDFSQADTPIVIQIKAQGATIQISVQDQGVGIPGDQLEEVFEPFTRAKNNLDENGAGLGLYLTRSIVEKHNGTIQAESRRGRGTNIVITLPAIGYQTVTDAPDQARATQSVPQRAPTTIMIVEGKTALSDELFYQLENNGYEILPTPSAREALSDLHLIRLDLILIDSRLNDGSGLDLCQQMRQETDVPIIIFSDRDNADERIQALSTGADDFITGPVSPEEMVARINAIIKRKSLPDRMREPLEMGTLYINFARREVFVENQQIELTRIEYDLLHVLAINKGQVLTHKQILEKVWGPEYRDATQYLWVNVSRLRKKLEPNSDSPRYIHTQPGTGYIFREP